MFCNMSDFESTFSAICQSFFVDQNRACFGNILMYGVGSVIQVIVRRSLASPNCDQVSKKN